MRPEQGQERKTPLPNPSGRNKRTVWTIATQPMPEAHFATFPEKLIEPCILAGTSEKGCCVECGSPWERIVEKSTKPHPNRWSKKDNAKNFNMQKNQYINGQGLGVAHISKTIGWQPTCKCKADIKSCIVLDPFIGSGTTAIVASKHNRKFIGIDLSESYLKDIAIPRIEKATKQLKLF